MKKIATMLFSLSLVFGSISIITNEIHIEASPEIITWDFVDFTMDMNITEASAASFWGEAVWDELGSISGVGDVNGDGFDDILIGAKLNDAAGQNSGQAYLIFGKTDGWSMDTNLSQTDASFIGEEERTQAGGSVAGAGDVNGDGFDDMLIGARWYGNRPGKTYLIFGKATGWSMDTDLSQADASFIGEEDYDYSGGAVSGAGDVNGDGFDDILIGAGGSNNYAGQTYLILGKATGWSKNIDLSHANASFIGEDADDGASRSTGAGDVNGDGYDDILIGASSNGEGGDYAGQTYLIFGKATGWSMDTDLSQADASFIGETARDRSGGSVSGAGDVNGDGYDDILIGAGGCNNFAGQTYLILGKSTGWSMNTILSLADASFIGENADDGASSCSHAGDVNGDGFDDILIGAGGSDDGGNGAGQIYLIYGKSEGWSMDSDLSKSDASFCGEDPDDGLSRSVGAGDVNGDGFSDILMGTQSNDEGGLNTGQSYLIMSDEFSEPLEIYSIEVYSDPLFSRKIDIADYGEKIYIELVGLDGNESNQDRCSITLANNITYTGPRMLLKETGLNTGVYRGEYIVNPLHFNYLEKIVIFSMVNSSVQVEVLVHTPVQISPRMELIPMPEDVTLWIEFSNFGYNPIEKWEMNTNSNWTRWINNERVLTGAPYNFNVGSWWVNISAEDEFENRDFLNITIEVINEPPKLSYLEKLEATEDIPFEYDFNCDDELFGGVTWDISPSNIHWLDLNAQTGVLSGTPSNGDDGTFEINISAEDEHGGISWVIFNLIVHDVNDPPIITTEPISEVLQEEKYYVQFNAKDEDDINVFEWRMNTDAQFLEINNQTGVISGTPENEDVGIYSVNVTTQDLRGEKDWLNFTLEVIDVNDAPSWVTIPPDSNVDQGKEFTFTIEAFDVDPGDTVSYSISSQPESDISIDEITGEIAWIGSLEGLTANPKYILNVEVFASDGEKTITYGFTITVIPNPSPTSTILGPENGKRITSEGTLLEWKGEDDGEEPLQYNVYFGQSQVEVSLHSPSLLWMEDFEGISIQTGDVERGKTYYWTVIPRDIYSSGYCPNDVFSFSVNIPPSIQEFSIPQGKISIEFRLSLMGSDQNGDDLEFVLEEGPNGMEIFDGMISWIPSESQVGTHSVNVSLSDGYETIYSEFEVEVAEKEIISEPDEKESPIGIIIIVIIVILILIGAGFGAYLYLKKKGQTESEKEKEDTTPEDNDLLLEQKQDY